LSGFVVALADIRLGIRQFEIRILR
jgi:hypothetical protein